ncbi:DNA replication and repair protein RecR [Paucidesulfovibrio gracilis DSM 16080]|uniref:Recombination protein RecR n=1 Tax=Paucidesulfovibrio gracilis DSM 16080 TaxID=1121449 RepID=A0A1T4WIL9_9BACT|nr:recombination mediator RecR [Paucidesulfovibrio gracilis]SKA77009.1 DNA replication and repair protein RecR [Paucidesulfovibrio gracilis DSM 16080]
MQQLPAPLREVVDQFAGLPGIGPKSALRIALTLLKMPEERARAFGRSVLELRDNLCLCQECGSLSESNPCQLCSDPERDDSQLCVVAEWDSLLVLEEMGQFRGRYMILGGLLDPLSGNDACSLEFERLRERMERGTVRELILALGATLESETTCSHVKNLVEKGWPGVRVSRLAQGIPMGGEVKYMDKETLRQSLMHRQSL